MASFHRDSSRVVEFNSCGNVVPITEHTPVVILAIRPTSAVQSIPQATRERARRRDPDSSRTQNHIMQWLPRWGAREFVM